MTNASDVSHTHPEDKRNDSRSGERRGCGIPLGYEAAWPPGGNVRIHHDHDGSAGVDHMDRSSGSGCLDPVVERVSCFRGAGYGTESASVTGTSICRAWAGLRSTAP